MKRYTTCAGALLLASTLVSCGGESSDDGSGGTPGGNPGGGSIGAFARVEESEPPVSTSGTWTQTDPEYGWSGGASLQSTVAGSTASFTFTGTSVRWIGARGIDGGIALVKVDQGPTREVDLFAQPYEIHTPIITIYGLRPGTHTLTIEVTGRQHPLAVSNVVVVDAFEVNPPVVSHLQETDPDLVFSAGWEQADSGFIWSGGGVRSVPAPPIGGARVTETMGAKSTLTFRGTAIVWSGYRGPDAGIALVQVDGGTATEVDTYSPGFKVQDVVFTATGLTDTTHTLTIEATGRKNAASTAAKIVVDAFDVTTPGRRFQEEDAAIVYTGPWNHGNTNRVWSEGAVATSGTAGARATFTFTGTSVSYIGCQKASIGPTKIFLDGVLVQEIDNFKAEPIEAYQHTIFRADGLARRQHTLTIEASTTGPVIAIDGFDVRP